jgi:hypothetical protein
MVGIVIAQALILYEANELLSFDSKKTVLNIKSPAAKTFSSLRS